MMESLLSALYSKLISWIQAIFNAIFGNWNFGILFSWLPSDIQTVAASFILILFAIGLIKVIRDLLPF